MSTPKRWFIRPKASLGAAFITTEDPDSYWGNYRDDKERLIVGVVEASAFDELLLAYNERGMAMRDTGDVVRALYEPRLKAVSNELAEKLADIEGLKDMAVKVNKRLQSVIEDREKLKAANAELVATLERLNYID